MVEPVIPDRTPRPKGGRPPISNRAALTRIVFVLKTGTPWKKLTATGNGLWQRDDFLEKIEGLATGRRLGEDSVCDASALA